MCIFCPLSTKCPPPLINEHLCIVNISFGPKGVHYMEIFTVYYSFNKFQCEYFLLCVFQDLKNIVQRMLPNVSLTANVQRCVYVMVRRSTVQGASCRKYQQKSRRTLPNCEYMYMPSVMNTTSISFMFEGRLILAYTVLLEMQ